MTTNRNERHDDSNREAGSDCWQAIAADPERLRYWREIARLWRGSLAIDTDFVPPPGRLAG